MGSESKLDLKDVEVPLEITIMSESMRGNVARLFALRSFHCILSTVPRGNFRLTRSSEILETIRDALFLANQPFGLNLVPEHAVEFEDGLDGFETVPVTIMQAKILAEAALLHALDAVKTGGANSTWRAIARSADAMAFQTSAGGARKTDTEATLVEYILSIRNEFLAMAQEDEKRLTNIGISAVLSDKIWRGEPGENWAKQSLIHVWGQVQGEEKNLNPWLFWSDWYQGFIDGKPLDWELQRRVALIPDEDWDKGPEHIAALIEEIREPFILKERIAQLEAVLPKRSSSRHDIGGNNPPDDFENIETAQQAITIIWASLDDLKDETEKEQPDWEKVKAAIAWLGAVLRTCAKWLAGHVDAGIREAAKAGGKATAVAGVGYVALSGPEVQAAITKIVESASKWFNFFN